MAKASKAIMKKAKFKPEAVSEVKPLVLKVQVDFTGNTTLLEVIQARAAADTRPVSHQILHELKLHCCQIGNTGTETEAKKETEKGKKHGIDSEN